MSGLSFGLTGLAAQAIAAEARLRGVAPDVLASTLLSRLAAHGGISRVLGAKGGTGLTRTQEAMVYLVGLHAGPDGWCRVAGEGFALMAECSVSAAGEALRALERRGLLAREPGARRLSRLSWRLTDAGRALAGQLGDFGCFDGGKA